MYIHLADLARVSNRAITDNGHHNEMFDLQDPFHICILIVFHLLYSRSTTTNCLYVNINFPDLTTIDRRNLLNQV